MKWNGTSKLNTKGGNALRFHSNNSDRCPQGHFELLFA